MKIIQFMASQEYGGAEKVFVELSNALAEQFEVIALLLCNTKYKNRFTDKVHLIELKSNPTRHNPFLHFEIYTVLRKVQPDLIHTHAAKASELVKGVNRFLHIPHLGTKHNDRKGRVFNSLPWVTTVSEKVRSSVLSKKGAKVRTIYNGIVEEKIKANDRAEIFTILAIGRLDPIKGFDLLIRQVAGLLFPFRLKIVGEGPENFFLNQLIASLELQDRVELTGFCEDIPQLMADSHLVVISSYREGCPNVMIEAMYYAPMLIATPVGAVCEVLPEMLRAAQSQLGEKINDVYRQYDLYTEIFSGLRRQKKECFSFLQIVDQYAEFYREILGRGGAI